MQGMPDHRAAEFAVHVHNDRPYPATQSLQQYAARLGLTPREAYAAWHDRSYAAQDEGAFDLGARGPGLGLHLHDIPAGAAGPLTIVCQSTPERRAEFGRRVQAMCSAGVVFVLPTPGATS